MLIPFMGVEATRGRDGVYLHSAAGKLGPLNGLAALTAAYDQLAYAANDIEYTRREFPRFPAPGFQNVTLGFGRLPFIRGGVPVTPGVEAPEVSRCCGGELKPVGDHSQTFEPVFSCEICGKLWQRTQAGAGTIAREEAARLEPGAKR